MTAYQPATHPSGITVYWERTPHSSESHVLPPDLFAALGGEPDSIFYRSGGVADRRFYPSHRAAMEALQSALAATESLLGQLKDVRFDRR